MCRRTSALAKIDGGMLKPRPPPSQAACREVKAMLLPSFTCGQPVVCAACHCHFPHLSPPMAAQCQLRWRHHLALTIACSLLFLAGVDGLLQPAKRNKNIVDVET